MKNIRIKPNVARFTEHDVIFEDGTAVCNVDAVIFGTGYSFQFPIVEDGNLIPVTDNKVDLYLHIFPLQLSPKNTLAVIGLIQPIGSIMPVSEMQSRFYCEVFAGHCKLPAIDKMKKDVERRRVQTEKRFLKSRRHTLEIKPNVARFTEHDVIFEDGTAVCNVDAVIFGTGYSFQFPIVEDGNLIPVTDNKVDLYLHIFPLQLSPK
ncbi:hypothetical protein WUBG_17915, partial [Wuchereria bancrofti]